MDFINDIFNATLPELMLLITIFTLIIFSLFYNVKYFKLSKWISMVGIFVSTLTLSSVHVEPVYYAFSEAYLSDSFTVLFKSLILLTTFFIILLSKKIITHRKHKAFQYYALVLTASFISMLLVSANDFLTLFVLMESLSITLFFLISFNKGYPSKEATLKYLITNSFATAVYLFGVSYLYGITSSLNFMVINDYFLQHQSTMIYSIAVIFIAVGLLFKLAIVPFSNWIVDVYEGASTVVAAYISIVPKLAMFAVFARLLVFALSYSIELPFVLIVLAMVTALWANTLALREKNIKRILACSSSANVAYIFLVLSLVSVYNLSTVLFYLIAYIFMNIGVFAAVIVLENSAFATKLYEFKGYAYSNPLFTCCFSICLFALAGLPLTSGFIAKLYLLSGIVRSGNIFIPVIIILFIVMVIGACYYINIIKLMFEKTDVSIEHINFNKMTSPLLILYVCTFVTLLLGVAPSKIIELCQFMAYYL